jgi:hypothetical protein
VILYGREAIRLLRSVPCNYWLFFSTDADDFFSNEEFFLDISSLYDNMDENGGISNINANANANMDSSFAPYVFMFIDFVLQFLGLAIGLDMLHMFFHIVYLQTCLV